METRKIQKITEFGGGGKRLVSNGKAESINSLIKTVKIRACGFRTVERFTTAIYFYLVGLELYPEGIHNRPPSPK